MSILAVSKKLPNTADTIHSSHPITAWLIPTLVSHGYIYSNSSNLGVTHLSNINSFPLQKSRTRQTKTKNTYLIFLYYLLHNHWM